MKFEQPQSALTSTIIGLLTEMKNCTVDPTPGMILVVALL